MSDASRWAQVTAVFQAALEHHETARGSYLEAACAGDSSLRAEVESLLAAYQAAGRFAEGSPLEALPPSAVEALGGTPRLTPGSRLGRYEIVAPLGAGGMGDVYRARDATLNRDVAAKVLPDLFALDRDRLARFTREAQILAALNHPNIVTVHAVEEDGDVHFITMELVEGQTLAALLPSDGLALDRFFEIAIPLVDAVAAAHAQGIVHRDLKPANVMITPEGRVKALDFGLARPTTGTVQGPGGISAATESGMVVGTHGYLSPEQARGQSVDPRADIFALGVVLYEMLTGRRPFTGETPADVLSSTIKDVPADVSSIRIQIPRELSRIVKRCLAKEPVRRYQSALDLKNALEELQQELDSGELAPAQRRTRRAGLLAGAAAAAIVAVAAWVASAFRSVDDMSSGPTPLAATFAQLTTQTAIQAHPSLSPDGQWFIYTSNTDGDYDIYLQSVGGQTPINLTADESANDLQPAFSPDGKRIAFRSNRLGGGIFVMGRTGESVRRLTDEGFSPAWSPDGREVVFATENRADPYIAFGISQLWAVSVASGEKRLVADGDAAQPSWSPNGHRIAFWGLHATDRNRSQRDIWTVPATGGTPVSVTNDWAVDSNPVWSPDGRHLYFASDRGGTMNLWRVAIDERSGNALGEPQPLTTPSPNSGDIGVSADGSRIAFRSMVRRRHIYRYEFDPIAGRVTDEGTDITEGAREWGSFDLSRDGQWLSAYLTGRQEDIFIARTDGTRLRQLTDDGAIDRTPRWAPDGKRIAFYSNRGGSLQIWSVNPDGSNLRMLTESDSGLLYPVWSPDGSRMAVTAGDPGSAVLIFDPRRPWKEQTPEPLPAPPGGTFAAFSWSPDGTQLSGWAGMAGIVVYSFATRTYERLTDIGRNLQWMADSRRILFNAGGRIMLIDRDSKREHEVLSVEGENVDHPQLSFDERHLFVQRRSVQSHIWLATMSE